jgi:ribosomal protein S18 acetylase RimI-like enzyme
MELLLSITRAEKEDAAAVTRLINSAYRGETANLGWTSESDYMEGLRMTDEDMERLIDQPHIGNFKCCTPEEEIVGFISLEQRPGFLYLSLLTVSPLAQAGGIGKHLLAFADAHARSLSKPAILLTVVNIRTELIAWYERRGYLATGETMPFPIGASRPKVPVYLIEMKKEIH